MGLRVNGQEYPWSLVSGVAVFIFWLGGLSILVYAADERSKTNAKWNTEAAPILAVLESESKNTNKTVDEIKAEAKETNRKLDRIIEKLSERAGD